MKMFKDYNTLGVRYGDLQARVHEQETRNLRLHEGSGVASVVNCGGGGGNIHIFVFTDHENNRFQKELITQNTKI